jgi:sugar-specific transcriptional regulator TrmB
VQKQLPVSIGGILLSQENLKNALQHFGATEKEADVYIFLAKRGTLGTGQIARQMKKNKGHVYRILSSLEQKGLVEVTLEVPKRFTAVLLEKVIDAYVKAKQTEISHVEKTKEELLEDWKRISQTEVEPKPENFSVVEGNQKIYRKISEMIEKTENEFSAVSLVSDFVRAEQFGVLDSVYSHPRKNELEFRFLTDVNQQNLKAFKLLRAKLKPGLHIKSRNPDLGLALFPRMVIRDSQEILFFISPRTQRSAKKQEVCISTNCNSLVQAFTGVFTHLWRNSTDINEKIAEVETGKLAPTIRVIDDAKAASKEYDERLSSAETEILIVTSSKGLLAYWKQGSLLKKLVERGASIEIMAPVSKENLKEALQLSELCKVRHVPRDYMKTTIIDRKHLFQFKIPEHHEQEQTDESTQKTFYTNDFEYIEKTRNMLMDIWKNSVAPSAITAEYILTAQNKEPPEKSQKYKYVDKRFDEFRDETLETRITQQDVINKILNYKRSPRKSKTDKPVVMCTNHAAAIIRSHKNFNLPDTVIEAYKIDERSSFGAEDGLVVYLWLNTPIGYRYVPVAAIQDNPRSSYHWKKILAGTPAGENCHLVKKEELQMQLHGSTFFVGWTKPIPLLPNQKPLPPAAIIFEATEKLRTIAFSTRSLSGMVAKNEANCFDAFLTFIHEKVKYQGPATDGIFSRELYTEWHSS